jgi:hypothetical protein
MQSNAAACDADGHDAHDVDDATLHHAKAGPERSDIGFEEGEL